MKKIFYLISFLFAMALVGCEEKEPPTPPAPETPSKVETGAAENITATSAMLKGMVNVDITDYKDLEFGVLYSTKAEDLVDFTAPSKKGLVLIGNEFKVEVTDLKAETKYYYRAYVMLNTLQILLGDVKEFTTLEKSGSDEPEAPDEPYEPEEPETPEIPEEPEAPDEPEQPEENVTFVAKPFSVALNKRVTFSSGNLQYHPLKEEWRFAPSQLDYIGEDNANISATYKGWIDLLGWGTGNNPANNSTNNEDYPTFVDWGVNKIGNDAPNTWRTLTNAEWEYIINGRYNAEELIGVAQVNGVNGLILLPDGWTCPSGVTFKSGVADNYGDEYYASYQSFSASEWSKLEASGAVFLPAAGIRDGSDVYGVQYYGYYWSATEGKDSSTYYLRFYSDESVMYYGYRTYGRSVRLVKDN